MSVCVPGDDLVLAAAAIAITISKGLSADDTNDLANLFSAIGNNLNLIASKKEECEDNV